MPDHQNQATLKYNQILVRPSCRLFLNWQSSYLVRRANLLAVIWRRNVIVIQKKLTRVPQISKKSVVNNFFGFWHFCYRVTSSLPAGSNTLQHSLVKELGKLEGSSGEIISSHKYLRSVAGSQPVIIPFIKLSKQMKSLQE